MAALRWWLLSRAIRAPTSWKKSEIVDRLGVSLHYITKKISLSPELHSESLKLSRKGRQLLMLMAPTSTESTSH